MEKLLIADDDREICQLLAEYLGRHGFACDAVHNGAAALQQLQQHRYQAVILDVMMPELDGFETLQQLRRNSRLPVIMLTARGDDVDRIVGLEMGADDYLPKPANPRELLARLRAVLRRATAPAPVTAETLRIGELELQPAQREAWLKGQPLQLTGAEYELLAALVQSPGLVVSKDELAERALGRPLGAQDRSLDMQVSRLRRKLGERPDGSSHIKSLRNRGYLYLAE